MVRPSHAQLIRSCVAGLVFAALLGLFVAYRGDFGRAVAADGAGGARVSAVAALNASTPEARAIAYDLPRMPDDNADVDREFFVGHLIAKPWRAPAGAAQNAQSAAGAITSTRGVGNVRSASVGAFFVELASTYRAGVDPQALDATDFDTGLSCEGRVDQALLASSADYAVACAVDRLRASGQFEYVERDYVVNLARQDAGPPVNDPLYPLQWPLHAQGTRDGESAGGAGFAAFWTDARQPGSRAVRVAVIDNGVDFSHPQIAGSDTLLPGIDAVSHPARAGDGDGRDVDPVDFGEVCFDPFGLSDDEMPGYHGTQTVGLIGAALANDAQGLAGAGGRVGVVPVRAVGACGGLMSDVAEAIVWASGAQWMVVDWVEDAQGSAINWIDAPAQVIHVSVSFPAPDGCPRTLQDAISIATQEGAIVVVPAGNNGGDASEYAPGNCEDVITVAAGDAGGRLAFYSNAGEAIDIMAPGGDLGADDNGDGRPDGIPVLARSEDCFDAFTDAPVAQCEHMMVSGTSYAAGYVSAALALLASEYPDASRDELVDLLVNVARTPRTTEQCPRGCGAGLLNLERAATLN